MRTIFPINEGTESIFTMKLDMDFPNLFFTEPHVFQSRGLDDLLIAIST